MACCFVEQQIEFEQQMRVLNNKLRLPWWPPTLETWSQYTLIVGTYAEVD